MIQGRHKRGHIVEFSLERQVYNRSNLESLISDLYDKLIAAMPSEKHDQLYQIFDSEISALESAQEESDSGDDW